MTHIEQHPSLTARIVRKFRKVSRYKGWERLTSWVVRNPAGGFLVDNEGTYFAGDLSSFIDRRVYLFGGYETELIDCFLAVIPSGRRRTILDIGANVGTHSLAFARHFQSVHAFEPNPSLWATFERNVRLNHLSNVCLHKVGVSDRDGELPFFLTEKSNFGLGTCSPLEQYDVPLRPSGNVKVVEGDSFIADQKIGPVDAIKIDVQGLEPEVLQGLASTLHRDMPIVWAEIGPGTTMRTDTRSAVRDLVPYPCALYRFAVTTNNAKLVEATEEALPSGDYVFIPV